MPNTRVSPDSIIDVETTAFDFEDDVLTYNYEISAGRIIGTGPRVKWDLTGIDPGTYTITAGVDDGCGLCGVTKTEQITVTDCEAICGLISCPSIKITGPDNLRPGGENLFTANVSGAVDMTISYTWSVTIGTILSGQGSPSIKVKTPIGAMNKAGSVSVRIGGLPPAGGCTDHVTTEFVNGRKVP